MIYFVTTFSLEESFYEELDENSSQYKKAVEIHKQEIEKYKLEQDKYEELLNQKYSEYFTILKEMYDENVSTLDPNLLELAPEGVPHPTKEELNGGPKWPHLKTSDIPVIKNPCWKVVNSRTPIFFNDLEKAKSFVQHNDCDWEEAGYYTMAYICGLPENSAYVSEKEENSFLYSCDDGWVDVKFMTYDCTPYLSYKNKIVFGDYTIPIG